MMRIKLIAGVLALAITTPTFGQQNGLNIVQFENEFKSLKNKANFKDAKGWKWKKRWLEHYAQRTTLGKDVPDLSAFNAYALEYNKTKNHTKSGNTWIPYGPNFKPDSPNPNSSHGVSRINCIAFHPTDANTFWIGASQGGVWKTSDAGQSWSPQNNGLPILRISDIQVHPNNPDILYASLGDYEYNGVALNIDDRKRHTHYGVGLYKSTDGGLSWHATGLTTQQTKLDYSLLRGTLINPDNPNEIVAGGLEGIWKTYDGGDNWIQVARDTLISDLEQDPLNSETIFMASTYIDKLNNGFAGVLKSTDFGDTWTVLNTGIPRQNARRVEIAVSPQDPNYVYALSCNLSRGFEGLYRSTDGGTTWNQQSSINDGVNILDWYEGTGTAGQGSYDLALTVSPTNKNEIYTGGINIWGSEDGGQTWKGASYWTPQYGESVHADQHQLRVNPVDNMIYLCNDGGVYRTDDIQLINWGSQNWPTQWEDLSDGMQITSFYRLGLSKANPGAVIAGAQDNSTFYFDGTDWINVIGGDGMECFIFQDDPNMLMGSWQYGGLAISNNGGNSFSYGVGPNGEAEWTTPMFYHENEGRIYVGIDQLYYSDDYASSWNKISNFPSMSSGYSAPASHIAQSKNNPEALYVAKRIYHSYNQPAELWVSQNGGATWSNMTSDLPDELYFTYIEVDDNDPNLAWVTCSGFEDGKKVYQTSNGGTSWQNISLNLPNIPVNTIVSDETDKHQLFIGTDLGVYTLNDNSTEWSLLGDGLPNVIVSELEIDFASQELFAATFGRGIWKTSIANIGIEEMQNLITDFSISPNPNSGSFHLKFQSKQQNQFNIEVIDIMGRTIYAEKINALGAINKDYSLDLKSGVYFLKVSAENNLFKAERFIVK